MLMFSAGADQRLRASTSDHAAKTRVGEAAQAMQGRVEAMIRDELDLVEAELGRSAHIAGAEFSAADVQMMFPLEFAAFASLVSERLTKLRGYIARMQARPAYQRALKAGGPYAFATASD